MNKTLLLAAFAVLLAACGEPRVEVVVPLAVISVSPHDGATGIDRSAAPTVCFNREVDAQTAASSLSLEVEGGAGADGQAVKPAGVSYCLSLEHHELKADTLYVIRLAKGLLAADGTPLAAELTFRYRTAP
ncbi:MAG: Ig-like domain-containing protein [Deltaproteobacteria bacterium]|nr:Ig-like domain-containing protein [Deltaproteobacteria bacterium]